MPKRIQRKRTKGWRMPPNTVYVGRPSKWGNPFKVEGRNVIHLDNRLTFNSHEKALEYSLNRFNALVYIYDLSELKGKDLACWCKIGEPCHADILLKLANK